MRTNPYETLILSAELSTLGAAENRGRTVWLRYQLDRLGISYRQAEGCYKGTREASFVVKFYPSETATLAALMRLAERFGQESVLRVDVNNRAYLVFLADSSVTELGNFGLLTTAEAEKAEGYTELGGLFYGVVP